MLQFMTLRRPIRILVVPFLLLIQNPLFGQTLALSSGSAGPGGTVPLNLNLTSTSLLVGLQLTLSYSPGDVAAVSIASGSALTTAGKTLSCNAGSGSLMCLASGLNSNTIGSGVAAVVTVTLASATRSSSVPVSMGSTLGALADGTTAAVSGTGGIITVQGANPVPTITSLSPTSATAGTAAFTLTVNGSGFISGSVVNWNGSPRTTSLISATQLQAAISATDIATAGTAQVTVSSPAPGGGTSGSSAFTINATNPLPAITSLSPASATTGGAAFTLTVNGSGFISGSVVNWNGSSRTTTYVSATQLQAAISAADIATVGTAQVTVFNPAPGGGTSGTLALAIKSPLAFVYVGDYTNGRVVKFDSNGNFVANIGSGMLNGPSGIGVDSSGNIYVACIYSKKIFKFDSSGNFVTSWGSWGSGQLGYADRVFVDSNNNVWVTEVYGARVLEFDSNGNFLMQFGSAGTGIGQLNDAMGIAVDSSGNVYVGDNNGSNGRVQKFNSSGNYLLTFDTLFENPVGIVFDLSGNVWVVGNAYWKVFKFNTSGTSLSNFNEAAGNGEDMGTDSSGNLYIVDTLNNQVLKYDGNGNLLTTFGTGGSGNGQFNCGNYFCGIGVR